MHAYRNKLLIDLSCFALEKLKMMIHYNKRHHTATDADRDSAGLDAGAVVNDIDPMLFFDELPQPFRFIDKIVEYVISTACDQVDSAIMAQARSMRLSKQQLTELSCLEHVNEEHQIANAATPIYPIGGSLLLFFSNTQQLVLWDASEMAKLDFILLGEQTLLKVDSFEVSPTRFLVVILTQKFEQSIMTVVGVLNSKFQILAQQDISVLAATASDCLISPRAEAVAVSHSGNDEVRCVDIYTLQTDAWFRALDAALIASQPQVQSPPPMPADSPSLENAPAPAPNQPAGSTNTQSIPTTSESERGKLAICPLALRYKYPVLGASVMLSQFVKASEIADGLCLGTNNLLSPSFLSLRQNLHNSRLNQFMPLGIAQHLPTLMNLNNVVPAKRAALFKWLSEAKIVIAWPEVCCLVVYSAIKPPPPPVKGGQQAAALAAEQIVEGKTESSWPLSSPVIALSTSPSLQVLGVLLEEGNLLVLNSGNVTSIGNIFSWAVSATLSVTPKPTSVRKFSVIESDRIVLETSSVFPPTALNFSALVRYQKSPASMNLLWKFNSLDIGCSDFAFVEVFEQWPSLAFLGLPDGSLLLCERDSFKQRLTTVRLPDNYAWPSRESSANVPPIRLTSDGRILFALAHYEAFIQTPSAVSSDNKLFRFDLVAKLPAYLISRWTPTINKTPPDAASKTSVTAIANQVIKQSVSASIDTAERLKKHWAEERDRNKDSRN